MYDCPDLIKMLQSGWRELASALMVWVVLMMLAVLLQLLVMMACWCCQRIGVNAAVAGKVGAVAEAAEGAGVECARLICGVQHWQHLLGHML